MRQRYDKSLHFNVVLVDAHVMQVSHEGDCVDLVALLNKTCSCRLFNLYKFPYQISMWCCTI